MNIFDAMFRRRQPEQPDQKKVANDGDVAILDFDRRRSPRLKVMRKSAIMVGQHRVNAMVLDISRHGARIATRTPRSIGEVVGVCLEVKGVVMQLPLKLIWDRYSDGAFEAGGQFVKLTEEETTHLHAFLADVSEGQAW